MEVSLIGPGRKWAGEFEFEVVTWNLLEYIFR